MGLLIIINVHNRKITGRNNISPKIKKYVAHKARALNSLFIHLTR